MIPLASDLLPFPDQMRREGHLKSAGPPDRLSSSGRITILGTTLRSCREVIAVPVDKIAWRCKQATERINLVRPHSPCEHAALQTADITRRLMRGGEPHHEEAA
jgi:hypothetical protein